MRIASLALAPLLIVFLSGSVLAQNDKGHGHGNSGNAGKNEKNDRSDNGRGNSGSDRQNVVVVPQQQQQIVIVDRDRDYVHRYYRTEYLADRCPPGLAKKNNGCLPPGQENRVWAVGQPLPPAVVYYEVPRDLYVQLSPPPVGYQYVRVDNDVVLIAVSTRVIAGLLGNLGGFSD